MNEISSRYPLRTRLRFSWLSKIVALLLVSIATLFFLTGSLTAAESTKDNSLSSAEEKAGWKLLFDGKSFANWRPYDATHGFPSNSWTVLEGCIHCAKSNGRPGNDLLTVEQFSDFDFSFEWRMSPAGNSGVKYFVTDRHVASGKPLYAGDDGKSAVGHEYQLLDDERHPDGRNGPLRQSGALYSLVPPNAQKTLKPVGEFNHSRIVVQGKHVEHWLNGAKILEYELESPALMKAIAASKYKDVPRFGTKFKTSLLLQNHGEEVWFRNLKIRPLPSAP